MTTTVQTIGDQALQIIGQLRTGRTSAPEEQAEYLRTLNDVMDEFNAEHLKIYEIVRDIFAFTAQDSQYSMGPGGGGAPPWTSFRPARVEALGLLSEGAQENPIRIISYKEWSEIPFNFGFLPDAPVTLGSVPRVCWIQYFESFLSLKFYPTPAGAATNVSVYFWQPLPSFASLTTPVTLPPAYEQLLEYTLALKLAARYRAGRCSDWIMARDAALAAVERMNAENVTGWLEAA